MRDKLWMTKLRLMPEDVVDGSCLGLTMRNPLGQRTTTYFYREPVTKSRAQFPRVIIMSFLCVLFLISKFAFSIRSVSSVSSESTPLYLRSAYPLWEPQSESPNSGERLLLTPYLNRGKIEEARKVAKVGPGLLNEEIPSYSGYLTIDKNFNSNLFFWFFPSQVSF